VETDREAPVRLSSRKLLVLAGLALVGAAGFAVSRLLPVERPIVIDVEGEPLDKIALSPLGDQLAASGKTRDSVLLWTLDSEKPGPPRELSGAPEVLREIEALRFTPGGGAVVALSSFHGFQLWKSDDGLPVAVGPARPEGRIYHRYLSPRGDVVALVSSGALSLWALPQGGRVALLRPIERIWHIAFSESGDVVEAFEEDDRGGPRDPEAWSVPEGEKLKLASLPWIHTFLDRHSFLEVIDLAGKRHAEIRDLATGAVQRRVEYEVDKRALDAMRYTVSSDLELFAVTVGLGRVEVLSLRTGNRVALFPKPEGTTGEIEALVFSPSGEHLAGLFGRRVVVWRVRR
jgi:WD40 repeat protein